tara:strand:- start:1558 stop:2082 length:525 start_codon:yes stop_codon:yes gene_type:complete
MFCVIYYGEEPSSAEYLMWGIITICSLYGFFVGFYKFFFACFFEVDEEQESIPVNVPVTTSTITPPPVIKQPPKRKPVVTKQDWDEIVLTAIEQAKNGNASARSFLLKNNLLPSSPAPTQAKNKTPSSVVKDTVNGLVSLGYSKSEATSMVTNACKSKVYSSASELISDIIKSP